jgi:branched-chain amino acid transport system permease protein
MVLCTVVLGGMGNFLAVILGAFIIQFISYLPQLIGLSNVIPAQAKQIIFGLILVLMMIYRPQGILGRKKRNNKIKGGVAGAVNGAVNGVVNGAVNSATTPNEEAKS